MFKILFNFLGFHGKEDNGLITFMVAEESSGYIENEPISCGLSTTSASIKSNCEQRVEQICIN
jgi:hypothetical protein